MLLLHNGPAGEVRQGGSSRRQQRVLTASHDYLPYSQCRQSEASPRTVPCWPLAGLVAAPHAISRRGPLPQGSVPSRAGAEPVGLGCQRPATSPMADPASPAAMTAEPGHVTLAAPPGPGESCESCPVRRHVASFQTR